MSVKVSLLTYQNPEKSLAVESSQNYVLLQPTGEIQYIIDKRCENLDLFNPTKPIYTPLKS